MWNTTVIPVTAQAGPLRPSTTTYAPMSLPYTLTESSVDGSRWYVKDNVFYPSITTLLTATDTEGQAALRRWRSAVGQDVAAGVTERAAKRGTKWHAFCESYLLQEPPMKWQSMLCEPSDRVYAETLTSVLNERLDTVFASESRVVSTVYGIAGRMDVGAQLRPAYGGRRVILDFKTGKKPKTGNRLTNYALQATFYADALSETCADTFGTCNPIDTIVIVQLCPDQIVWQESSPVYWRDQLHERVKQFASTVNDRLESLGEAGGLTVA